MSGLQFKGGETENCVLLFNFYGRDTNFEMTFLTFIGSMLNAVYNVLGSEGMTFQTES